MKTIDEKPPDVSFIKNLGQLVLTEGKKQGAMSPKNFSEVPSRPTIPPPALKHQTSV